ncbi:MAG: hypothetical protein IT536_21365 [Hyphomicrobiales bacterium]|nr:hypothetical protein [Hyphomicrobiales bacterium]
MRVLLSEGASTSAREAITALGLRGHDVEVCDPNSHCMGRFSRFVRRFHRCPPLGADPQGYLEFILRLVASRRYDVLLPIHEQGLLLAKARALIEPYCELALPRFETYVRAHNKLGFSQILAELDLPQPSTRVVGSARELLEMLSLPAVLKTPVGTASRGTWIVRDPAQREAALAELAAMNALHAPLIVQSLVEGEHQQTQAVFADGRLVAAHAYRQSARGAGGGSAAKESVNNPEVRAHLARLGAHLQWHGALSLDYIVTDAGIPHYFDCNPRLVEPMSAAIAGLDLVDILLQVSCGRIPAAVPDSAVGVRTHIAVQALLGCAAREGKRASVLRECWHLFTHRGRYRGSREELTPVAIDWMSFVPPTVTALVLLAKPSAAHELPRRGWGAQLLTPQTIRAIEAMDVAAGGG